MAKAPRDGTRIRARWAIRAGEAVVWWSDERGGFTTGAVQAGTLDRHGPGNFKDWTGI